MLNIGILVVCMWLTTLVQFVKRTPSSFPNTIMATIPTADDPNFETIKSAGFVHSPTSLRYAVVHVFLPVQPPDKNDYTPENEHSLARSVCAAAHAYGTHVCGTSEKAQWHRITRMLDNLQTSVQSEHTDNDQVISQLQGIRTGGALAIPSRFRIVLTHTRYPCVFHQSSKCRDYPHEARGFSTMRGIRGVPK